MIRLTLVMFLSAFVKVAFPQAEGIFVYEDDYSSELGTGKVVTKIYESKSMARIESTNTLTKSPLGAPDTKDQNVIIMDFDKLTETHLHAENKTAIVTAFFMNSTYAMMKKMGTEVTIQNLGQEKIGKYNCTHYAIVTTNPKYKTPESKKEIWTTKALGIGNVYYVGSYLYYPKSCIMAGKLDDAGAGGIVVRWQIMDPLSKKPLVCNLVSYQAG